MHASGPVPAEIMIIGDSPDAIDAARGNPYGSYSSLAFRRLFKLFKGKTVYQTYAHEKQLEDSKKLYTAVSKQFDVSHKFMHGKKVTQRCWTDKLRLLQEITMVKPCMIILAGAYPLFLMTGESKANDFRGSHWSIGGYDFVSTLNPYILDIRQDWIDLVKKDFGRVMTYLAEGIHPPEETLEIFPTFERVLTVIEQFMLDADAGDLVITADIETTPVLKVIDCLGLSISDTHAICIPFTAAGKRSRSYFDEEEEVEVWYRLRLLFAHPNVYVCGQNWQYDGVWTARWAGIVYKLHWDTMIAQHVLFAHLDKNLGFIGSLYNKYHKYWKDERKGGVFGKEAEKGQWLYNCKDVLRTRESMARQKELIVAYGLEQPCQFQHNMYEPTMYIMFEGHRIDHEMRRQILVDCQVASDELLAEALYLLDEPLLNLNSPKQMVQLFYEDLGLPKQYVRKGKKKSLSCDENSMIKFSEVEPLMLPITQRLSDVKSLGKVLTGSPNVEFDDDGRFRCDFVIPGTKTYRYASRMDAFGMGTNAQNITAGGQQNIIEIPNLRKMFITDPGYLYFAIDLDRADAQVVAWEANDLPLKQAFANNVDIHNLNTAAIYGSCSGVNDPNRPYAKAGVHAMNYVVQARTLGMTLGISTAAAQKIIDAWFEAHPAIKDWHARVEQDLCERGYVENAFGYRCYFKQRIESILSEAVAWAPQSTVANVTNQALYAIHKRLPRHAHVRMQVHDELVGCIAYKDLRHTLPILRNCFDIAIPYDDPLTIPVGLKVSDKGWGYVKDAEGEFLEMWNQEIII